MNIPFDLLTTLAACLCEQIDKSDDPPTCFCGVIPGDVAVGEYAGDCDDVCGMAWVRLVSAYPATGVGVPNDTVGNCSASLGMDIELGIMRCHPVHEDGSGMTDGELAEVTRLQTSDMMTMWRAVVCCDALNTKDYILSGYTPMGPMGGLVGGAFTVRTVA